MLVGEGYYASFGSSAHTACHIALRCTHGASCYYEAREPWQRLFYLVYFMFDGLDVDCCYLRQFFSPLIICCGQQCLNDKEFVLYTK